MANLQVRRLPVVNREKRLVGILSLGLHWHAAPGPGCLLAPWGMRMQAHPVGRASGSRSRWKVGDAAHMGRMRDVAVRISLALAFAALMVPLSDAALAEKLSREQVIQRLAAGTKDLSNLEAPGADLSGVDFRGAKLFGANLKGANLENAKLRGSNLDVAILRDATLTDADLRDTSLFSSVLANANLTRADLSGARVMANLEGAILEGANLSNVKGGADMRNQPMGQIRAFMSRARLKGARLTGADFSRADLSFADLREAELSRTNLMRARLVGADLSGAKLDGAMLEGADLENANFKGARGLASVRGLESTVNRESAFFD